MKVTARTLYTAPRIRVTVELTEADDLQMDHAWSKRRVQLHTITVSGEVGEDAPPWDPHRRQWGTLRARGYCLKKDGAPGRQQADLSPDWDGDLPAELVEQIKAAYLAEMAKAFG